MSEELKYMLMARACSPELANDICAKLDELAALKAQQPAATAVPDWFNKEVADVDSLLRLLGVDLGQARSEGGRLRPLHVYGLLMDKFQAAKDALAVVRRAAKVDAALDKVATGTFVCPLCGRDYPHQHSPEEITIYGNGRKAGLLATRQAAAPAVPDDLRGWIVLRNAIECLRAECYFRDEEGEDTDALEELLAASGNDASKKENT